VCNRCFEDPKIVSWIEANGDTVKPNYVCESCGKNDGEMRVIDAMDLSEKLQSVIMKHYTHEHIHGLYGSAYGYAEGDEDPALLAGLSTLDDVCFSLFADDSDKLAEFIVKHRNWRAEAKGGDAFFDSPHDEVWKENCWFDDEGNLWYEFSENIKYTSRFFDHKSFDRTEFLNKLLSTLDKLLIANYPERFYRARLIETTKTKSDILANPTRELDKPPNRISSHNRFSPTGISYIYLADSIETALMEIGSKVGDESAYGEFIIEEGLKIVDLRRKTLLDTLDWFDDEFDSSLFCFLSHFTGDISKPIAEDDKAIDYIPTQIVSEFIDVQGYGGFLYDSSRSRKGYNLVLFERGYNLKLYGVVKSEKMDYRVVSGEEIE